MDGCEAAVAMAMAAAKRKARRLNIDPGELLGHAWERAASAPPVLAAAAADMGCRDAVRYLTRGTLGRRIVPVSTRADPSLGTLYGEFEPLAPPPDCEARTLELWQDTTRERATWPKAVRVWVALMGLEGWTTTDVAKTLGVPTRTVQRWVERLASGRPVAPAKRRLAPGDRVAGRVYLGRFTATAGYRCYLFRCDRCGRVSPRRTLKNMPPCGCCGKEKSCPS